MAIFNSFLYVYQRVAPLNKKDAEECATRWLTYLVAPRDRKWWICSAQLFQWDLCRVNTHLFDEGELVHLLHLLSGMSHQQDGAPQLCERWFINHEITTII